MKVKSESEVSHLCLTLATPWTTAYQAPQSMGFSRQKYWSGVPLPSPFIDIWLHWVLTAAPGLSLAAASRGYSAVVLHDFSLWGFSCCRAHALGCAGSVAVVHGLSCLEACGIFPDQGSNLCPPALQGRFLIPEPQGKFHISVFKTNDYVLHCPGLGVLACFMIRASSGVPWSPQGLWRIHKRKDSRSIVFFCIAPRTWRLKSPPPLWIHLVHSWSDSHLAQHCPHTEGPQGMQIC